MAGFASRKAIVLLVLIALVSAIGLMSACSGSPAATATPAPQPTATTGGTAPAATPTSAPGGKSVSIDLVAQGISFDKSTVTVPAGASVTVNFNNKDSGIPHNFAVYDTSAAGKSFFVGQTVTGPATMTYKFTAPATPGTYFFRCDVHPTTMTGSFVVTP